MSERRCGTCRWLKRQLHIAVCEWYPSATLRAKLPVTWHDAGGIPVIETDGVNCPVYEAKP